MRQECSQSRSAGSATTPKVVTNHDDQKACHYAGDADDLFRLGGAQSERSLKSQSAEDHDHHDSEKKDEHAGQQFPHTVIAVVASRHDDHSRAMRDANINKYNDLDGNYKILAGILRMKWFSFHIE